MLVLYCRRADEGDRSPLDSMLMPDTSECRANEHAQVGAYEDSLRLIEARESRQAVLLRQHMRLLDNVDVDILSMVEDMP